uniref:Uncharacterized protein n=1 Tax=Arundo donax TaxID=35708 RepID=A0A0A9FTZ8_ARUDO
MASCSRTCTGRSSSKSRCECGSMLPLLMGAMAGDPPVRVQPEPYRARA